MAPSRMLSDGSWTADDSVTVCAMPRPWHRGQAPTAVLGENESDSSRGAPDGYEPAREKSMRIELDSVVSVPTVDRVLGAPRRCCSATAGGRPVIESTCGLWPCAMSRRAYGATDSRNRRWASAKIVPNASDDFPDPDTPVNATMHPRGTSTFTSTRLFSRAPRTRTNPSVASDKPGMGGAGSCKRVDTMTMLGARPECARRVAAHERPP